MRGDLLHDLVAVGDTHAWPGSVIERLARGGDGSVHVGLVGFRDGAHDLFRVGRDQLDEPSAIGRAPFPADPDLVRMLHMHAFGLNPDWDTLSLQC